MSINVDGAARADVTLRQWWRCRRKWGSLVCISIESIGRFAKLQRAHHHPTVSLKDISSHFLPAYNSPSNLNGDLRPITIGCHVFSGRFTWFEFEVWMVSIILYLLFHGRTFWIHVSVVHCSAQHNPKWLQVFVLFGGFFIRQSIAKTNRHGHWVDGSNCY